MMLIVRGQSFATENNGRDEMTEDGLQVANTPRNISCLVLPQVRSWL